jgi:hypothetical protein
MNLRRALCIAAMLLPAAAKPAVAQFPPAQQPPCMNEFSKLRDDAAKKANSIRLAQKHKVSPKEACHLFNVFSVAEQKLIKYAEANQTWCGIPPEIIKTMKQGHSRTNEIRVKVCRVAAAPPRPPGPSLSDTLIAPSPDANNIKTGRGTFDTLTGSPLGAR